jgi:multidrug resistance protein, MATE family
VNRLARQTLEWGLAVVVPLSILAYALTPALLSLYRASSEVTAEATTHLRITSAALAVIPLTFVFDVGLRGAGNSRTPLYASLVASIVNAFATYVLVFGEVVFPRLEGAGRALGISHRSCHRGPHSRVAAVFQDASCVAGRG